MTCYASCADDFYINMNLNTEMDLPKNRETVLGFFERVQKQYPTMRNFYCRDGGETVLEEEKEHGSYRWATIEARRVCSGYVNPTSIDQALEQHRLILEIAPYMLSVSRLDCESLNLIYGFDFTYRGNHNKLLVEALGLPPAYEKLTEIPGASIISHEPSIQLALEDDCRVQIRVSVETRTSAYHVRTGEYPEEQLSVYVTARRFGGLDSHESYVPTMDHLAGVAREFVDGYVMESVLRPLQQAIAIRCCAVGSPQFSGQSAVGSRQERLNP